MENNEFITRNKKAQAVIWRKAEDLDIDSWVRLARVAMPVEAAAAEDPERWCKALEALAEIAEEMEGRRRR